MMAIASRVAPATMKTVMASRDTHRLRRRQHDRVSGFAKMLLRATFANVRIRFGTLAAKVTILSLDHLTVFLDEMTDWIVEEFNDGL
jgi:hypothetical protein